MNPTSTLYVLQLPTKTTKNDVTDAFGIFGDIKSIELNSEKGTCLVEFEEAADSNAALDNMDLSEIYGETIRVVHAKAENLVNRRKAVWDGENAELIHQE